MPTTRTQTAKQSTGAPNVMRELRVRNFAKTLYEPVWRQMQTVTAARDTSSQDELWLLQHAPVFTIGLNGSAEHLLNTGDIPVLRVDRGGQVTYHGPGQLVVYVLLDLARRHMGVVDLVRNLEQAVIDLLAGYRITGHTLPGAPGVYVDNRKLAAVGLRVKRGRCYHGMALNIDMDLRPFKRINPCGFAGLSVTQLRELGIRQSFGDIRQSLTAQLTRLLGYTVCADPPGSTQPMEFESI